MKLINEINSNMPGQLFSDRIHLLCVNGCQICERVHIYTHTPQFICTYTYGQTVMKITY